MSTSAEKNLHQDFAQVNDAIYKEETIQVKDFVDRKSVVRERVFLPV